MNVLFHFSEDPTIVRFEPHVPRTNPSQPPAVWAIDEEHAPLYWFPRDCPRVTAWPRDDAEAVAFREAFCTTAPRVHAAELGWAARMRDVTLYRYVLHAASFRPWDEASGQWISDAPVETLAVEPMGDLIVEHVRAGIELRFVPSLWPLRDLAVAGPWDFSLVRMPNAIPRQSSSG
jgi:hypothetical protein